MSDLHRLSRRLFLRDAGKGTLAIAVLGPTVIACSSSATTTAATSTSANTATSGVSASTSPSPTNGSPTTQAEEETTTEAPPPTEAELAMLRWERVVLGGVSAYVLARGNEIAVVDTGFRGSDVQIGMALSNLGANWDDVNHVVLTHLHGDHVGGLGGVMAAAPQATGYAGSADVASISSPRPLTGLNDGDEVFGLQVISTPGHTPGHISVLDEGIGFLVAGDALNASNGMIVGPNPSFSSDINEANNSVRKLATKDFDTAAFGHGDPFVGAASEAVVALAESL